jgi:WD40 repeat protein
MTLSPDGRVLALGDRNGTVTLLDAARRKVLGEIPPESGETQGPWPRLALAFSPDGRDLAVGSPQGIISIWGVARPSNPRLRLHLPGHRGFVDNLVFEPQGRRLAAIANTGAESIVEVWDLDLIQRELMVLGLAE